MLILRIIKFIILDTISYKTVSAHKKTVNKDWILVDANGQNLGRLASSVAILLRGKNKPNFSPHVDCGDNVVVINSEKVNLSGNKWSQKNYIRYTGYPGGQRTLNATELFNKNPNTIIEKAVKGMLPKNKLGSKIFKNLHVNVGENHKFSAQNPKPFNFS